MKDALISWHAEEYKHIPKDSRWFKRALIVASVLFIISISLGNFLFSFLIAVGTFTFLTLAGRHPDVIEFGITQKGVFVDKTLHPFQNFESFWIRDEEDGDILSLKSHRHIMPYIILPLGDADIARVHEIMLKKLPEVPHEKTFAEIFTEYIGY
jgi:hypothetical protein